MGVSTAREERVKQTTPEKSYRGSLLGLLSLLFASTCCWLPLFLIALGVGLAASGFVRFMESARPVLAVAAFALLGAAGYFTYLHKAPGEC